MKKITIVDAPCGYGKTSWAINYMNKSVFERFIFITPFLTELDRVIKSCNKREFKQPNERLGEGSKKKHFYKMLDSGVNICSTHSLFRSLSVEVIEKIKEMKYILILDEVADVVENLNISKSDIKLLLDQNIIFADDDFKVHWADDSYSGKFNFIKDSVNNGDVYLYNNAMILWTFPANIFKTFKEVYVLTYMFNGQIQRYYYDINNVEYEYKSVELVDIQNRKKYEKRIYELADYKEINGAEYKELINIYEGKLNDIGNRDFSLSKTWYDKAYKKELMKKIKNNTYSYFKRMVKGKSKDNMWTVFNEYKTQCRGEGYTKGFVSCNARATNDYKHKVNLAYLCNRYYNPMIKQFFIDKGVDIDESQWALSELIQWIFRSAIREKKPINIYIPSKRMRKLFIKWLTE